MVLNTKTTQKIGHTMSPSQKICDSALDATFSLCVCEKSQVTDLISHYLKINK